MTNFQMTITHKEGHTSETYFKDSVIYYVSNDRPLPKDVLEHLLHTSQIELRIFRNTVKAYEEHLTAFLAERERFFATAEGDRVSREMRMMARYA